MGWSNGSSDEEWDRRANNSLYQRKLTPTSSLYTSSGGSNSSQVQEYMTLALLDGKHHVAFKNTRPRSGNELFGNKWEQIVKSQHLIG